MLSERRSVSHRLPRQLGETKSFPQRVYQDCIGSPIALAMNL